MQKGTEMTDATTGGYALYEWMQETLLQVGKISLRKEGLVIRGKCYQVFESAVRKRFVPTTWSEEVLGDHLRAFYLLYPTDQLLLDLEEEVLSAEEK